MTKRGIWLIGGLGVAVVAVVVVIFVVGGGSSRIAGNAVTQDSGQQGAELPQPSRETAQQSIAFLEGAGAKLMVVHGVATEVVQLRDPQVCRQRGEKLDQEAPPDEMAALASRVADEPLRTAFTDEHTSLGDALADCVDGKPVPAVLGETTRLIDERINQLRAAR